MIAIINVTPGGIEERGTNFYEVRINHRVVCEFTHERAPGALAQCLRDAADAVDRSADLLIKRLIEHE